MAYLVEYVPCELCGANDYVVVWNKDTHRTSGLGVWDDHGKALNGRIVVCRRCGLVYANPRMTAAELAEFYASRYRQIYPPQQDNSQEAHAAYIVSILKELKLAPQCFLDVGCSRGLLVGLMAQTCEAYGVDPGGAGGANIATCAFEDYDTDARFDLITILNTLEHVSHPIAFLRHARDLLTEDGKLLVCVPDIHTKSVTVPTDAFLSNAHLYHFSGLALTAMCWRAGLREEKTWGHAEEIGDKVYMLTKRSEPQYLLPTLDDDYVAKLKTRLRKMDEFYELKRVGFR